MRHAAIALVLSVGSSTAGRALSPTPDLQPPTSTPSPTFEVASIKPNKSDTNRVNLNLEPGGRFTAVNVSLQTLIGVAYGDPGPLPPNRMVLNQKWIGGVAGGGYATADRFDIEAKAGRDLTNQELAAALRSLLEDRFKLSVHHETRTLPIYALVMDRPDRRLGPRLKRSAIDCTDPREYIAKNSDGTSKCGFRSRPGTASGRQTIAVLTRFFTNAIADHRPVEDRTGLSGTFDFELDWAPEVPVSADAPPGPPVDPNGPSIFTAAREQMGLKLEPGTTDIAVLVVDRAERPTEN